MSNVIPHIGGQLQAAEFTPEQVALIKATVAKGATDNELKLFLYRCQKMGLDPLKPGQVHFIKYGTNPGSVVVGIDGFRVKAQRTGKLAGIERRAIRDENGHLLGAWCEVYRSDWQRPAREEVSLAEYSTGKAMWAKMPETMIKKVAEAAALRMAFPDDLGGMYAEEEMHQSETRDARPQEIQAKLDQSTAAPDFEASEYFEPIEETVSGPGDYVIKAGANKGKRLGDLSPTAIKNFISWYDGQTADGTKKYPPEVVEYYEAAHAFLSVAEKA